MEAEALALQMGLRHIGCCTDDLDVVMDNKALVDAINGTPFKRENETTAKLTKEISELRELLDEVCTTSYVVIHEPRCYNSVADGLARSAYGAGKLIIQGAR